MAAAVLNWLVEPVSEGEGPGCAWVSLVVPSLFWVIRVPSVCTCQ